MSLVKVGNPILDGIFFRFSHCLMRIKEDSKFSSNSRVT